MGLFPNRKTSLENIKRQRALNAALKNCTVDPKKKVSALRGGAFAFVLKASLTPPTPPPLPPCRKRQPPPPPLHPQATRRFPPSRRSPASVLICRDTRSRRRRCHRGPPVPMAWFPQTPVSGTSRTSTSSSPPCQVGLKSSHIISSFFLFNQPARVHKALNQRLSPGGSQPRCSFSSKGSLRLFCVGGVDS